MPRKKIRKLGKPHRQVEAEWQWRESYQVWDAAPKILVFPENWAGDEIPVAGSLPLVRPIRGS